MGLILIETMGHEYRWGRNRLIGKFRCPFCRKENIYFLDKAMQYKSCGCMRCVKHGDSKIRLYKIWKGMKKRCNNRRSVSYKSYGAKGISICKEWLNYINFKIWALENGYRDNLTIDRINNNGNYCPENCRWITKEKNLGEAWQRKRMFNTEEITKIRKSYRAGTTIPQLANKYLVSLNTIHQIITNKTYKEAACMSCHTKREKKVLRT